MPKAQRRTAWRLFEGLQAEGYLGAYDSVQRFVQRWKANKSGPSLTQAFVPLRIVADGVVIAEHARRFGRDLLICDPPHGFLTTTCPFWSESPERCAMACRSVNGNYLSPFSMFATASSSSPAATAPLSSCFQSP